MRSVAAPPARCPEPDIATTLELTKMEMEGVYPNVSEWALDQVVPFCEGVNNMGTGK